MAAPPQPTEPSSTSEKILFQGRTEENLTRSSQPSPAELSSPASPTNPSEAIDFHHKPESDYNLNRPSQSSPRTLCKPSKALHIDTGCKAPQYHNGQGPRTGDSSYTRTLSVDPEKQALSRSQRSSTSSSSTSAMSESLCGDGGDRENELLLERKALKLLV